LKVFAKIPVAFGALFSLLAAQAQIQAPSAVPPNLSQIPAPALRLTGQFPGPFQDTLIQRWQDSSNGATCYLYIPIMVQWINQQPSSVGHSDFY
jgi:hypothetical protein